MVGRVSQVSFRDRNLLVFYRTTPRSRGEDFKTLNYKDKEHSPNHKQLRNCRIYRRNPDGWREKISGRRRRRFRAKEAAPPTLRASGGGGGAFVGNAYDRRAHGFPHYGKLFTDFSTLWKIFGRFFHAMEKRLFADSCGWGS